MNWPFSIFLDTNCNNNILDTNKLIQKEKLGINIIIFNNCNGNLIINNIIKNNTGTGLLFDYRCANNTIENNKIENNRWGITLRLSCNNNTFINNNIRGNNFSGVLSGSCDNNSFDNNKIIDNCGDGFCFSDSSNNILTNNLISRNGGGNPFSYGVDVDDYSVNNQFYSNSFANLNNAFDEGKNFWYNNKLNKGNYWNDSNFIDINNDCISDVPYNIPGGDNIDLFPLLDKTLPVVTIKKPIDSIYLTNREMISFLMPLIFGNIEIEINIKDSESGIKNTQLKIGNKIVANIYNDTYICNWDDFSFGFYKIEAIAFDNFNNIASDSTRVLKFDTAPVTLPIFPLLMYKRWMKTFGGTINDYGISVQQTTDRGYIVVGSTYPVNADNFDVWLIKTDDEGNKIWDKTFGGIDNDYGHSVQQTIDGGYIITGWTSSYGTGNDDVWLIKTNVKGDKVWDRTFGGTEWENGYSVQQTSDRGYIITGRAG
ncbi:MAG: right-handed parallel beta-helix repeat-containing protein, partial [Candidatus Thermoplasmatota archaeon]|nr:right-handed parallel beta-helix repeat-containing protein [Candidatus Thermoplasmatota archaeon]